MLVICSYCRKTIGSHPGGRVTDVSHGMCEPCAEHFGRLWDGMQLGEYLDGIGHPVVVVDGDGRVVAVNGRVGALLGREPSSLRGLLGGEAMACVYSRLPEGCGKTVHCRECTIRGAVDTVARTGRPLRRQPAWLKQDGQQLSLRISVRPAPPLIEVIIEEAAPTGAAPDVQA